MSNLMAFLFGFIIAATPGLLILTSTLILYLIDNVLFWIKRPPQ